VSNYATQFRRRLLNTATSGTHNAQRTGAHSVAVHALQSAYDTAGRGRSTTACQIDDDRAVSVSFTSTSSTQTDINSSSSSSSVYAPATVSHQTVADSYTAGRSCQLQQSPAGVLDCCEPHNVRCVILFIPHWK